MNNYKSRCKNLIFLLCALQSYATGFEELKTEQINLSQNISEVSKPLNVLTFGTFDLFHIGHLNILKRAKEISNGGKLIVGVSSDQLNFDKKERYPVINEEERIEIIRNLKCTDIVFCEKSLQLKTWYIDHYKADLLLMGDDWQGKFDDVHPTIPTWYLSRTPDVSTTEILDRIQKPFVHKNKQTLRNWSSEAISLIDVFGKARYMYDFQINDKDIVLEGFSYYENWGIWTIGNTQKITLNESILTEYKTRFLTFFYSEHSDSRYQLIYEFSVSQPGVRLIYQNAQKVTFDLSAIVYDKPLIIDLHIDNPVTPSFLSGSDDQRVLGLGFYSVFLHDEIPYSDYSFVSSYTKKSYIPHISSFDIANNAYRLAYVIQSLFDFYDIPFYFSSGTLLGALRHGGFISWDDDLDCCLREEDLGKFEKNIIPLLRENGWKISSNFKESNPGWIGYQISYSNFFPAKNAYLDIFVVKEINGEYVYPTGWPHMKMRETDIFPIRKLSFGNIMISVPNRYEYFLDQNFGLNWREQVCMYNHQFSDLIDKETSIQPCSRENTLPSGPFLSKWPIAFYDEEAPIENTLSINNSDQEFERFLLMYDGLNS